MFLYAAGQKGERVCYSDVRTVAVMLFIVQSMEKCFVLIAMESIVRTKK